MTVLPAAPLSTSRVALTASLPESSGTGTVDTRKTAPDPVSLDVKRRRPASVMVKSQVRSEDAVAESNFEQMTIPSMLPLCAPGRQVAGWISALTSRSPTIERAAESGVVTLDPANPPRIAATLGAPIRTRTRVLRPMIPKRSERGFRGLYRPRIAVLTFERPLLNFRVHLPGSTFSDQSRRPWLIAMTCDSRVSRVTSSQTPSARFSSTENTGSGIATASQRRR